MGSNLDNGTLKTPLLKYKDALDKHKEKIEKISDDSSNLFEKQLSYISAGSLSLSFIIVENFFDTISSTHFKALLIIGWILLAVTLLLNLYSHNYAGKVHNESVSLIDEFITNGTDIDEFEESEITITKGKNKIDTINTITLITLIIGIVLIIAFTSINIS